MKTVYLLGLSILTVWGTTARADYPLTCRFHLLREGSGEFRLLSDDRIYVRMVQHETAEINGRTEIVERRTLVDQTLAARTTRGVDYRSVSAVSPRGSRYTIHVNRGDRTAVFYNTNGGQTYQQGMHCQ